eukprot:3095465-Rhodomonas_salina.1
MGREERGERGSGCAADRAAGGGERERKEKRGQERGRTGERTGEDRREGGQCRAGQERRREERGGSGWRMVSEVQRWYVLTTTTLSFSHGSTRPLRTSVRASSTSGTDAALRTAARSVLLYWYYDSARGTDLGGTAGAF